MPYYFVNQNHIKHYLLMAENDQLVKKKIPLILIRHLGKAEITVISL